MREKHELKISKDHGQFVVEEFPYGGGSPIWGRGRTMKEAIGDYFHARQADLNIVFIVDETARPTEMRRRRRELSKR